MLANHTLSACETRARLRVLQVSRDPGRRTSEANSDGSDRRAISIFRPHDLLPPGSPFAPYRIAVGYLDSPFDLRIICEDWLASRSDVEVHQSRALRERQSADAGTTGEWNRRVSLCKIGFPPEKVCDDRAGGNELSLDNNY